MRYGVTSGAVMTETASGSGKPPVRKAGLLRSTSIFSAMTLLSRIAPRVDPRVDPEPAVAHTFSFV